MSSFYVDKLQELTTDAGVFVDGVFCKDGNVTANLVANDFINLVGATVTGLSHTSLSDVGIRTHAQLDIHANTCESHIDNATLHRVINDSGTSPTELWSASKLSVEFDVKSNIGHVHVAADVTDFIETANAIADARISDQKGAANGLATLDGGGKIPASQLNLGSVEYQGTWNANTNTPLLLPGIGRKGDYYVVNVTGTTLLGGISDWKDGDWIIFNGTVWEKADHTDQVTSVAGKQGAVSLDAADITSGSFANARISESSVTQHSSALEGVLDHNALQNYVVGEHRVINDAGTSATELWSANKINSELSGKSATDHTHTAANVTSGTFADARISESSVTQHSTALETAIDHNNLTGFVVNEHLDHTTISITAGVGLAGGGTIAATRTLDLDINSLTVDASPDATADYVVTYDASATTHKKVLLDDLPGGVAGPAGATDNAISRFDGATGELIQNSVVLVDDNGNVTGATLDSNFNVLLNIVNGNIASGAAIDAAKIHDGSVSNTEFSYLDGVTGAIQTQFDDIQTSLSGKAATSHTHAAADVTSGTFADARISESSVTQHSTALEGVLDHNNLLNYAVAQHRVINDAGTSTTELWSASKIDAELSGKSATGHTHVAADVTDFETTANAIADARISIQKGAANGLATLDGGGKIPASQLSLDNVDYQGTWNANTNTPTLANGVGTKGHYYVVSVAGSTSIDSVNDWQVGDWIIFNGTVWEKADHTDQVTSVAGKQGAVILAATDVSSGTFSDARISESSVTQHSTALEGVLDHNALQNYAVGEHRVINDAGTSTTELWSANKINSELSGKASASHTHAATDVTSGTFADARISQTSVTQHSTALETAINHDNLTGFVANEHVDHSAVSITAGIGLTGGGTIAATRTLDLDIASLTADASPDAAADYVVTYDASATTHKKVLINDLVSGSGSVSVVQARRTTAHAVTDTWTTITFDATDIETESSTIEHDNTNTERINILETGKYEVYYHVDAAASSGTFHDLRARVLVNGVTFLDGSQTSGPNYGAGTISGAASRLVIANFTANDYVILQVQWNTSSVTGDTRFDPILRVKKLETMGATGPPGATGSGSSITLKDGGMSVTNTPHTTLNYQDAAFVLSDNGDGSVDINISEAGISHNLLNGFVANEHLDHTAISITAGVGLTGGGTIAATRTLDLDIASLTTDTSPDLAADYMATYDASAGSIKKILLNKVVKLINDTTPQLGGDLDLNEKGLQYKVPNANGEYCGEIVSATVDTNATGIGAALYMASDGNFDETDADASSTMPCRALAIESGTGIKKLLLKGFLRKDAWAWTIGGDIYVSTTTGALTQVAPSGSGDQVQKVGYAWDADTIYFSPGDYTIVEIA